MIAGLRHHLGERIQDRYEVLGLLGSGAFGSVYRCRDLELDTFVAVKELHVLDDPETVADERTQALAQFRREAIHLGHLRHPHIVSGHYQPHGGLWLVCPTCGIAFRGSPTCPQHNAPPVVIKQRHYLVMEWIDGDDLESAAQHLGGTLPLERALRYIRQVADALAHIHARGWVHRDVKPENIRLRSRGDDAVLLDFGIATESGAAGEFSTRAMRHTQGGGTAGYAPEDLNERRHPDARSDIHALGMTLYRVLSGHDPLESADLVQMRTHRPREFNAIIPPSLDELIVRCIARDPAARPQSVGELLEVLDAMNRAAPILEPVPASASTSIEQSSGTTVLANAFGFNSGETASNVTQLVRLCDKYPQEAADYLYNGDFGAWLQSAGRTDIAARSDALRREFGQNRAQGLEAFVQFTGVLPAPGIRVTPERLDFGTIWLGQSRTIETKIENTGRGHLFGAITSRYSNVQFPTAFDGNAQTLPITIDTRGLTRGEFKGEIAIDSSGGEVRVPYVFTVFRKRAWTPFWNVILWSLLGALSGLVMRTLPFTHSRPERAWQWLNGATDFGPWPERVGVSILFAVALWAALLMPVVGESTRRKSCGIFVSGALAASTLAFAGVVAGPQMIVAIDQYLWPALRPIVDSWAGGAWMLAGGMLGAIYGTARHWRDLMTTRLALIGGGWVCAAIILYAILALVLMSPRETVL